MNGKKRKYLIRILPLLLGLFVVMADAAYYGGVAYAAQEDDAGEDLSADTEEPQSVESDDTADPEENPALVTGNTGPAPAAAAPVSLKASTAEINAGTVSEGEHVSRIPFQLINESDITVNLFWQKDNSLQDIAEFDTAGQPSIPAQSTQTYYIDVDDNIPVGRYSGSFYFFADEDPDKNSVKVAFDIKVEEDVPVIKSIKLNPSTIHMTKGDSIAINYTVDSTGNVSEKLAWSVEGATSTGTTVDADGKLTVSADEGAQSLEVYARAPENPDVYGHASVLLEEGYYTVSVTASPSGGGQVNGGGRVKKGGSADVLAAANNGYQFVGWTLNGQTVSSSNRYTVGNVSQNMTLQANFTKNKVYIRLEASPAKYGSVSADGCIAPGQDFTIKAKPKNGFVFEGWKENGRIISDDEEYTLKNVTGDRKLTACFEPANYYVKLVSTPDGAGRLTGQGSYPAGNNVTVSAANNNGYLFKGWAVNGKITVTSPSYTIKGISSDCTLVAVFEKIDAEAYEIVASVSGGGGTIDPAGKVLVKEGSNALFTITPDTGYRVKSVTVDVSNMGGVNSYLFRNVTGPHSITAVFEAASKSSGTSKQQGTNAAAPSAKPETEEPSASGTETDTQQDAGAEESAGQEESLSPGEIAAQELLDDSDFEDSTGILQKYGLSEDIVRAAIEDKNDAVEQLFSEAYREGYFEVTVNNSYASDVQETSDGDFYRNSSVPNLREVFESVLTEDEELDILSGRHVKVNLDISNYDTEISVGEKELLDDTANENDGRIAEYMNISLLKTSGGEVDNITEISVPLEIVFNVPESVKGKSEEFFVVRLHAKEDGTYEQTILEDMDHDPNTITVETDRFSSYAIAYTKKAQVGQLLIIAAGALIILVVLVMAAVLMMKRSRRRRHAGRR